MAVDPIEKARHELAVALRWAERHGLSEGVCNHFSLVAPGLADHFLINPMGVHWSEMTPDDIVLVADDGTVVEGEHEVEASAFFIHRAVHRASPRNVCVLHTHMPYATALSLTVPGHLEWASQNSLRFYDRIAYDRKYNGLALADAEGARIAATIGDADVVFLVNHGVVVCGPTVAVAYDDLYYLERACLTQQLALATGQPLRMIDPDVCVTTARQYREDNRSQAELHFDALTRILEREDAAFAIS